MDKRQEKTYKLMNSIKNLLFYLCVNHNVGPESMNSDFFHTLYIKNDFFLRWPPYTPHSHTGPHHFIALHEGRCSIAISPGFPFNGQ